MLSLSLLLGLLAFVTSRYYEVAIIINQKPKTEFQEYLLENARAFASRVTAEAPSHPVVSLWNPVFSLGCPHKSRNPERFQTTNVHFPKNWPYWRGIALAQKNIWEDFCVYRKNVSSEDVIVIFEHDVWCVVNNCPQALEISVKLQKEDIQYLGWTFAYKDIYKGFPLDMHAYSITCAAILKTRNLYDPCGSAMDLQTASYFQDGTLSWETASAEWNAFGRNQSAYEIVKTNTTYPSLDEGLFIQIKNIDVERRGPHEKPGDNVVKTEVGMEDIAQALDNTTGIQKDVQGSTELKNSSEILVDIHHEVMEKSNITKLLLKKE